MEQISRPLKRKQMCKCETNELHFLFHKDDSFFFLHVYEFDNTGQSIDKSTRSMLKMRKVNRIIIQKKRKNMGENEFRKKAIEK